MATRPGAPGAMTPEGSGRCELCGAAARLRCQSCRLACYCDVGHQKADWVSIHQQICQLLIPIRTSLPCGLSEKERKHGRDQLLERQSSLTCLPDGSSPRPLGTGRAPQLRQPCCSSGTGTSTGPGPAKHAVQLKPTLETGSPPTLPSVAVPVSESTNVELKPKSVPNPLLPPGGELGSSASPKPRLRGGIFREAAEHIIALALRAAQRFGWDGKHKEAIPAALCALRFLTDVSGPASVRLVPAYLLLAQASTGAGDLLQASSYLSQAQWVVLRSPGCSAALQAELHRSLGLFCVAGGNLEQALYHLSNDIYLASSTFGLKSLEASGGYFHMANVFFRQNKTDIANSLYAEVTSIWHAFLLRSLHAQEQILESRPETAPLAEVKEGVEEQLTEAQQAEGIRVLNAVLDVREQAPKQQPGETARVLHALAMLWYLIGDLPKAREVGVKALDLVTQQPQRESPEAVGRLLKLINSKLPYTK